MSDPIRISELTELPLGEGGSEIANGDLLPVVDVSDTTQAASGTTKKTTAQGLAAYIYDAIFGFIGGAEGQLLYRGSTAIENTAGAWWDAATSRIGFGFNALTDLQEESNAVVTIKQPEPEDERIALTVLNSEGDSVLEIDNGHLRPTTAHFTQINNDEDEGAVTIDWTLSNKQALVAPNPVTVTFTDPPGTSSLILLIASSESVTWPGNVSWPGGEEPDFSGGSIHVVSFLFANIEGPTYLGTYSVEFAVPA